MIKDRKKTYELFEKTLAYSEAAEDWDVYVEASIEYGNSLFMDAKNDATENSEKSWPYILKGYNKAFETSNIELRLMASQNLMMIALLLSENLDSNSDRSQLALKAGDFIIENSHDDYEKFETVGMQVSLLHLKIPNRKKIISVEDEYLNLANRIDPSRLDVFTVGNCITRFLDIATYPISSEEGKEHALKNAYRFLINFHERINQDFDKKIGSPEVYRYSIVASRYFNIIGQNDLAIEFLKQAYFAISPMSPMDSVNVMRDLAMRYWEDGKLDDALAQMDKIDFVICQIWNNSAKRSLENKVNAIRTDLLMVPGYFARHFDFAAQVAIDSGKLRDAIAWREKGQIRFYKATILGELLQTELNDNEIINAVEQIVESNQTTLFLNFNSDGGNTVCLGWTAVQGLRKIDLGNRLIGLLMMLMETEFVNHEEFWDDYEAWKRTASHGRFIRWQNILETLSCKIGQLIFEPIFREFDCNKINKLVLIINGWMNGLPMQMAKVNGEFLIDTFSVVLLPSLLVSNMLPVPCISGIRLIDGLHMDLPWAKAEVYAVKDFFCGLGWKVESGLPHPEDNSAPFAGLNNVSETIFHFATHMKYEKEKSSDNAIIFNYLGKEKRIKLTDILNDNGVAVPRGSTVILSGCESNKVDIHGNRFLTSIGRAFLLSGASQVIS